VSTPSVLFVCVKNGGKSQLAAALMRQIVGSAVEVHSAGTAPGGSLNEQARASAEEVGATMAGEHPKPLDAALLERVDRVVVLGREAIIETPGRAPIEVWDTDEPSTRGIEGPERMRLIRTDITERVIPLAMELTGQPPEHALLYRRVVADLIDRFRGVFDQDEVRTAVREAHAALVCRARVTSFLPMLVERFARELLTAQAQADGRTAKPLPELLFVCVHNAGRSQIAAALARHLSGGRVNVRSAGSDPSGEINPVVLQVLAERGVPVPDAYPKPLTDRVVRAADVIVTMGCGDECPFVPGKRYEDWAVADPNGADLSAVRGITDDIQVRITGLLAELLH
jgi:protein-tyrosine-phosphatase